MTISNANDFVAALNAASKSHDSDMTFRLVSTPNFPDNHHFIQQTDPLNVIDFLIVENPDNTVTEHPEIFVETDDDDNIVSFEDDDDPRSNRTYDEILSDFVAAIS